MEERRGGSMEQLTAMALFLFEDSGEPGFLIRLSERVNGDPDELGAVLARALQARARAGSASLRVEPSELRLENTTSGGRLSVSSVPVPTDRMEMSLGIVDAERRPVAGVAVRVILEDEQDRLIVTDASGGAILNMAIGSVSLELRGTATSQAVPGASSINTMGESSVLTRIGPVLVNVLHSRPNGGDERTSSLDQTVEAALARLALARLRERVSGSCLWSLDAFAAIDELASLNADIAPELPTAEVVDALSRLTQSVILEGGAPLHDEVMPFLTRLQQVDTSPDLTISVLRREFELPKEFESFRRKRPRQLVVSRQAAITGPIIIGPDVHVAGLVSVPAIVEDRLLGDVREVRVTMESSIERHYAELVHYWPSEGEELNTAQAAQLRYHLTGFAAAYPAAPLDRSAAHGVLAATRLLQSLDDRRVLLTSQPPQAPRLYAGYIDETTPSSAVLMTPQRDGARLRLTCQVPARSTPLVIALEPLRTQRSGALDAAFTYAHQHPEGAAEVIDALAALESLDSDSEALFGAANCIRTNAGVLPLDRGVTLSMWVIRVAHSAMERASAEVLGVLQRTTANRLAERQDRRERIDEFVEAIYEIAELLAL